MRFKKILTKITTLVLALCILISADLVAFASSWDGGSDHRQDWQPGSPDGTTIYFFGGLVFSRNSQIISTDLSAPQELSTTNS